MNFVANNAKRDLNVREYEIMYVKKKLHKVFSKEVEKDPTILKDDEIMRYVNRDKGLRIKFK